MIRELIKEIGQNKTPLKMLNGFVESLDEEARTCEIRPINGDANFFDVRLQSIIEGESGCILVPKVGSVVTLAMLTNEIAVVVNTSVVDRVETAIGGLKMDFDKNGLFLGSQTGDLLTDLSKLIDLISSLHDIINKIQVLSTAPGQPSGPLLPNIIAEITASKLKLTPIKESFKSFLKDD